MNRRTVLAAQAAYLIGTGVWAVAHRRSFEWVSGAKTDYWLVRTVGALAAAIGAALATSASQEDEPSASALTLAAGSAAAFGAVDIAYAGSGRIRRIYLLDLAAQASFVAALSRARRGG